MELGVEWTWNSAAQRLPGSHPPTSRALTDAPLRAPERIVSRSDRPKVQRQVRVWGEPRRILSESAPESYRVKLRVAWKEELWIASLLRQTAASSKTDPFCLGYRCLPAALRLATVVLVR